MAISSRRPASGSIEKAIEALTDGLQMGQGADIQVPDETVTSEVARRLLIYRTAELT